MGSNVPLPPGLAGNNFPSETSFPAQTYTNPADTALGAHHYTGPNWQPAPAPPSFQQPQSQPAELSLGELLYRHPAARQLHSNWVDANEKVSLALEAQIALSKDNMRLNVDNMRLATELREVAITRRLDA